MIRIMLGRRQALLQSMLPESERGCGRKSDREVLTIGPG